MTTKFFSQFEKYYSTLLSVAAETERHFGKDAAWWSIEIGNDYLDLSAAIEKAYPREERINSLVHFDFLSLFQEIRICQLLFFAGYYSALFRNLRFCWEAVFRASHIDSLADKRETKPTVG